MALTTTTQLAANTLINYVTAEIKVLEPILQFPGLGVRRDVPKGWNQLTFPQGNSEPNNTGGSAFTIPNPQLTLLGNQPNPPAGSTNVGIASQGVNPTAILWGTSDFTVGLTQYGLIVQLTDIAMRNSAFELLSSAILNVKNALARQIDNHIQAVVMAGTQVGFAGGKTSRATLTSSDLISVSDYTNGIKKLRNAGNAGLKPIIAGKYIVIMHPNVETDFMNLGTPGAWTDLSRYDQMKRLEQGTINGFRGGVVMTSANVQLFVSTTTVYPTLFVGDQSFGWGYFQQPTPVLITTPDSNNVLNLFTSIGGKAAIGTTRFEEVRLWRVESAATP